MNKLIREGPCFVTAPLSTSSSPASRKEAGSCRGGTLLHGPMRIAEGIGRCGDEDEEDEDEEEDEEVFAGGDTAEAEDDDEGDDGDDTDEDDEDDDLKSILGAVNRRLFFPATFFAA